MQPVVNLMQIGHQRRVLLRCPGHDLGFDVIGQDGIKHQYLLILPDRR